MEIAGAKAPGLDLRVPVTTPGERLVWNWDLVRFVQPGDVILHWFTTPAGAIGIVGWSRAISGPAVESHVWVPRTHADIDLSRAERRPYWLVPRKDYMPLARPITRDQVETVHREVIDLGDRLQGCTRASSTTLFRTTVPLRSVRARLA